MIGVRTAALALALTSAPLQAHIVTVDYRPDAVVDVALAPGFATVIELERGETIETVVVGDSDNWQISSSARGDQLVIKPKGGAAPTDLVVTSDRRRYAFNLMPQAGNPPAFVVHFQYASAALPSAVLSVRKLFSFDFANPCVRNPWTCTGTLPTENCCA